MHFSRKEEWKAVSYGGTSGLSIFEHWSVGKLDVDKLWRLSREGSPIEALANQIERAEEKAEQAKGRAEQAEEIAEQDKGRAEQAEERAEHEKKLREMTEKRVAELAEELIAPRSEGTPSRPLKSYEKNGVIQIRNNSIVRTREQALHPFSSQISRH